MATASFIYDPTTDPNSGKRITFTFGLYGEEEFTVTPVASMGDTFDLMDAPEVDLTTENSIAMTTYTLAKFIRKMIVPEDRKRFDAALYRIPGTHAHLIVELATWITEQVTGFPTDPALAYSGGRGIPTNGGRSKP